MWGGKNALKLKLSRYIYSASHLSFQVQTLGNKLYCYLEGGNYVSGSTAIFFSLRFQWFHSTPLSTQFLYCSVDLGIKQEYSNLKHKLYCSAFNKYWFIIPASALFPLKQAHLFFSIIDLKQTDWHLFLQLKKKKKAWSGSAENCSSGSATMVSHVQVSAQQGKNSFLEGKRKTEGL